MKQRVSQFVLCAAVSIAVAVFSGCGTSGRQTACVLFDSSRSTRFIQVHYEQLLERKAEEVADAGGTMIALVATGDPNVEAIPVRTDFSDDAGVEKQPQRMAALRGFLAEIESKVHNSDLGRENPSFGSGIVGGIALLGEQRECDSVTALSDGLETGAFHSAHTDIASAADRRRLIQRLRRQELIPRLDGVELSFPDGGVLPQGINLPAATLRGLLEFWALYAREAGASFSWRVEQ
jgi:hypothetical protein